MFEYETEIVIRRNVQDVFDFVIRGENIPQWAPRVSEVKQLTPGPIQVGSKILEVVSLPFRSDEVLWEITKYEPPYKCTFDSTSFLGTTEVEFSVREVEDGSHLSVNVVGHGIGIFGLLDPLLGKAALLGRKQYMKKIKKILESQ